MNKFFYASILLAVSLALLGCPSPTSNPGGGTTTARAGKLSLIPISMGGGVARSVAGGTNLSPTDQALVAKLAASGLTNYTPSLQPVGAITGRSVTDAGNALGSVTVGSSGYTLFILQNSGTAPLYDVVFTVSDGINSNDFTLLPSTLSTLNTTGSSSFEPLVTLNIQHGNTIANGQQVAGTYNYLPFTTPTSANVTATVKIYAWNTSDPTNHTASTAVASADVELDATLIVTVNIVKLTFSPAPTGGQIDGSFSTQFDYTGLPGTGGGSFTNSGNVSVVAWDGAQSGTGTTVAPGDSFGFVSHNFTVNTGGVVLDTGFTNKIPLPTSSILTLSGF